MIHIASTVHDHKNTKELHQTGLKQHINVNFLLGETASSETADSCDFSLVAPVVLFPMRKQHVSAGYDLIRDCLSVANFAE